MTAQVVTAVKPVKMWPVPVYVRDLRTEEDGVEERNGRLRRLILRREEEDANPLLFGTIGATKTSLDILRLDDPDIAWLRRRLLESVRAMEQSVGAGGATEAKLEVFAEGWAVVYRQGASHRLHTHHESAWASVYYVATGGVGDDAGHLQLLDPRPAAIARQATDPVRYFQPVPGTMITFPAWLAHSVKATLAVAEGSERICIASNVGYRESVPHND